ncbi:hypothetical protein XENOCAPTIV_016590, partial [Xenoophorus captivus]
DSDPSMYDDLSSLAIPPPVVEEESELERPREFPLGFEPLRSEQLAEMTVQSSPVVKDPFCSPLLAPDSMLKGLPPVHIVVKMHFFPSSYCFLSDACKVWRGNQTV